MIDIEALKIIDQEYLRYGLPIDEFMHSYRVAQTSFKIGFNLKLNEKELAELFAAALFHDTGKAKIEKRILGKKGKLTEKERKLIEMHPTFSEKYLENVESLKHLKDVVRSHHERWDGKGYPDGLEKENIPYYLRIISIADVYDALKFPRVYRPYSFSTEEIKEILLKGSSVQFDPRILKVFLSLI